MTAGGCPETMPEAVRRLGRPKAFRAGAALFREGDPAAEFFRVESGEVRVLKTDSRGRELEVARLGPGDFFGEAVALAGVSFPFTAEAAAPTRVLAFGTAAVERAAGSSPETARFFIRLLAGKCLLLSGRVESLGMRTVRQRLVDYLLSNCGGELGCLVRLRVRKGELARLLGTVGETLSRNLKALSAAGLIEVRGPEIRILDCRRLRAAAGPDLT